MAHNHPSGPLTPSSADGEATKQIKPAGQIIGIEGKVSFYKIPINSNVSLTEGHLEVHESGI